MLGKIRSIKQARVAGNVVGIGDGLGVGEGLVWVVERG
jgi:hypothetical protein